MSGFFLVLAPRLIRHKGAGGILRAFLSRERNLSLLIFLPFDRHVPREKRFLGVGFIPLEKYWFVSQQHPCPTLLWTVGRQTDGRTVLSQLREGGAAASGLQGSLWERQQWCLQLHPSILPSPAGTGPEGDVSGQLTQEHSGVGTSRGNHQDRGSVAGGGLPRWVLVSFAAAMLLVPLTGQWHRRFRRSLSIPVLVELEGLPDTVYFGRGPAQSVSRLEPQIGCWASLFRVISEFIIYQLPFLFHPRLRHHLAGARSLVCPGEGLAPALRGRYWCSPRAMYPDVQARTSQLIPAHRRSPLAPCRSSP